MLILTLPLIIAIFCWIMSSIVNKVENKLYLKMFSWSTSLTLLITYIIILFSLFFEIYLSHIFNIAFFFTIIMFLFLIGVSTFMIVYPIKTHYVFIYKIDELNRYLDVISQLGGALLVFSLYNLI